MKKAKYLLMFTFLFLMIGTLNVKAIYVSGLSYAGSTVEVTVQDGVYYLNLTGNTALDLEIQDGEVVVLNLNGYTFTNYVTPCSAIYVHAGGTLTIIGDGNIKQISGSNAPVVNNAGTLTVSGGTIVASEEGQAALYNSGDLTIDGGTITTGANNVFGLVNEGTTTITGGNFVQAYNYSVINNASSMTISGGTFTISTGNTNANALITNQSSSSTSATLEITGGDFEANLGIFYNDSDEITISGGTFSHDVSEFLADGYTLKEVNGEYVTSTQTTTDETEEITDEETNPKTSDGILITIGVLGISAFALIIARKKLA